MHRAVGFFVGGVLATGWAMGSVLAATPTVTTLSQNTGNVAKYSKFEATFSISKTFPADSLLPYYFYDPTDTPARDPGRNAPYGIDGITINAIVRTPSGKSVTVPAFYYQEYTRSGSSNSKPVMTPQNLYVWKIRYAPSETGNYTYSIVIEDKEGSITYSNSSLQFTVVNSSQKGFVRVSNRDSRFWQFDNGQSFVPVSAAGQWWDQGLRSYGYESLFTKFAQNNINFVRIWDQDDGYNLTVENHFDAYTYPDDFTPTDPTVLANLAKGTQMNQRSNWEEDRIMEAAEKNGIYIQLCSHGDVYWTWDSSIYNESWNSRVVGFDDWRHINNWKRNFRYRVARWGYSTAVFGWETWNEHGHVLLGSAEDTFYKQLLMFEAQTDPYGHLKTTSQGSQAWSPAFWSTNQFDIANYHDYIMSNRYPNTYSDEVKWTYQLAQCLRTVSGREAGCNYGLGDGSSWVGVAKPIIWGELDTGTTVWNEANPSLTADHNIMWAGIFSPVGMVPVDWYYQAKAGYLSQQYAYKKIVGEYTKDIDYSGQNFTYFASDDVRLTSEALNTNNSNLRVLGMRSADNYKFYVWFQNRGYTWTQGAPAAQSGAVTLTGLKDGNYRIEYWNTETGTVTTATGVVSGGSIAISASAIQKSLAVKVVSTTISSTGIPTSTPIPQASPLSVLQAWGTANTGSDLNGDGRVNILDFAASVK